MWLVGSKPIRSNVTILITSFSSVFVQKWRHVSCIMTSSIILPLSILNIWRCGGLTALTQSATMPTPQFHPWKICQSQLWIETRRNLHNEGVPKQLPSLLNMALVWSIFGTQFSHRRTNNTQQQQKVLTSKVQVWLCRVAIAVRQQTKGKTYIRS